MNEENADVMPTGMRSRVMGVEEPNEDDMNNFKKCMTYLMDPEDTSDQARVSIHLTREPRKKWLKPSRRSDKRINNKERRKLGLYSLRNSTIYYNQLLPLHTLWKSYIKKYLNFDELTKKSSNKDKLLETASSKLFRADFHGAEIKVERSICPSYVGMTGIVAMETKNCFLIVKKDNTSKNIPKASSIFSFSIDNVRFKFLGKNFISRPADRSSRKIKTIHPLTL